MRGGYLLQTALPEWGCQPQTDASPVGCRSIEPFAHDLLGYCVRPMGNAREEAQRLL
jgi:hypothetical protein